MNLLAITWGLPEIVMILAVLLLLFGSTKLPKLARGLGSSVTEFRKGLRGEGDDEDKKKVNGPPSEPPPADDPENG
ncbi:MAG: twin-arginine translocase TatA/TatE family subunit [Planctomycetota bacterium]